MHRPAPHGRSALVESSTKKPVELSDDLGRHDATARPLPEPRRPATRRRRPLDRRAGRLVGRPAAPREHPRGVGALGAGTDVGVRDERRRPLTYDFWGFPQRYYEVTYAAPGAPELARSVAGLVAGAGETLHQDPARGLDHGAYVPLVEMFPEADIPTLQLSMPTLDPKRLFDLGKALAPLRDEGTLIVGSGFTTHNLHWFDPAGGPDGTPPAPSAEFDHWAAETLAAQDVDAVLDFLDKAPAARQAHPRTEHWAPLFVALGAAYASGSLDNKSVIDGFWFGLSKRSWQFA